MATRTTSKKPAPPAAPAGPVKPLWMVYLLAWFVPGAAHLWLGRWQKGLTFLAAILIMFVAGLWLQGRLFPFEPAEPLVALAAVADVGLGLPYVLAKIAGAGAGEARALTHEYGNAFLITAGLLNALVLIDAHDIALRRK